MHSNQSSLSRYFFKTEASDIRHLTSDPRNSVLVRSPIHVVSSPDLSGRQGFARSGYSKMAFGSAGKQTIGASITLQLLMYFNALMSFQYVCVALPSLVQKVNTLDYYNYPLGDVYSTFALAIWIISEILRLIFGLYGNTTESVPSISASLLLSCFPSLPGIAFLTFLQAHLIPYEIAAGALLLALNCIEIYYLWKAVRQHAAIQTARFMRLTREAEDEHLPAENN